MFLQGAIVSSTSARGRAHKAWRLIPEPIGHSLTTSRVAALVGAYPLRTVRAPKGISPVPVNERWIRSRVRLQHRREGPPCEAPQPLLGTCSSCELLPADGEAGGRDCHSSVIARSGPGQLAELRRNRSPGRRRVRFVADQLPAIGELDRPSGNDPVTGARDKDRTIAELFPAVVHQNRAAVRQCRLH